jgi:hypothetical protein
MMMRYFAVLLALVLTGGIVSAQDDITFSTADLPGSIIKDEKIFTGSNLWGHINGGADLFLEYGFKNLRFYEIGYHGNSYLLEIYQFDEPIQALGIYSIKEFGCLNEESLKNGIFCATNHSYIMPSGKYFITLANEKGTTDERKTASEIAHVLRLKTGVTDMNSSEILPPPKEGFNFIDFHIIMGPLGFQNGLPSWESFFTGFSDYTCLHYRIEKDGNPIDALLVGFPSIEETERFILEKKWTFVQNRFEQKGEFNLLVERDQKVLIILKGKVPMEQLELFQDI